MTHRAEALLRYLYWRHAYPINTYRSDWVEFLLKPFIKFGGTIAVAKKYDPSQLFSCSFGSKNHDSVGLTAGFAFDFTETIEIAAEAGATHFFAKDFDNFHLPTSEFQTGIYPFMTDVKIEPGANLHFAAKMLAYQFMGRLSCYLQYVLVSSYEYFLGG